MLAALEESFLPDPEESFEFHLENILEAFEELKLILSETSFNFSLSCSMEDPPGDEEGESKDPDLSFFFFEDLPKVVLE